MMQAVGFLLAAILASDPAAPPVAAELRLAAEATKPDPTADGPRRKVVRPLRDWRRQPFSRRSPWNHPIGSGARYAPVPRLAAFPSGLNYDDRWTTAVVVARATDPVATLMFTPNWGSHSTYSFLERGGRTCRNAPAAEQNLLRHVSLSPPTQANYYSTTSSVNDSIWVLPRSFHPASRDFRTFFHLPSGACPSPDSDGMMAVMQPDGWVVDMYAAVVTSQGRVLTTMASWIDVRGDGTGWWNGRRASMLPSFAGLIRSGELREGRIPHALAAQLPAALLKRAAVWPAFAFDRDSGYGGSLPMGALLAIPPSVDIEALGLSPPGLVIARAAQDYGVYVVDRGGSGITFLAELGNPDIRWDGRGADPPWWKDVETIKNALQQVTNNGPATRGGGGSLRVPLAAHLRPAS